MGEMLHAKRGRFRIVLMAAIAVVLGLCLAVMSQATPAQAESYTVTLRLMDSEGDPLAGGTARYGPGISYGYAYWPGSPTNASGETTALLAEGTYSFEMRYNNTTQVRLSVLVDENTTVDFRTSKVTLKLVGSGGAGLSGGTARYGFGATSTTYFFPAPNLTDALGETTAQLFDGTYGFEMRYAGTAEARPNTQVVGDTIITFYTTKVTLQYSGGLAYGGANGDSAHFTKPSMELLSNGGTVRFRLDGTGGASGRLSLSWPAASSTGATFTRSILVLRLVDSAGEALDGGTARYRSGYWAYAPGKTGDEPLAPGILAYAIPGLVKNVTNEMKYNNTIQTVTQDASVNSVYQFRTRLLTLRLETCSGGSPLNGGKARYGIGATYTTWWFPGGVTGTSAPGETAAQVFPGTYSFEMQYRSTAEAKLSVVVPDADCLIEWTTTNVTLAYNGSISYGGPTGDCTWFTKPSMELLAGTYKFHFRGGDTVDLAIGGCSVNKAYVLLRVLDESGNGVSGGKATPAYGGSWGADLPGSTDAGGNLFSEITPGYTKIRLTVNQAAQEQMVAQLTTSNYTWRTQILRIWLHDHAGLPITDGTAVLNQGGWYWFTWGNLNTSGYLDVQLFPGYYKFAMTYNYTTQELYPVVATSPGIQDFYFQTGQVYGDGIAEYAAGAWRVFTNGMELMPGTYTFRDPLQSATVTAGETTYLLVP